LNRLTFELEFFASAWVITTACSGKKFKVTVRVKKVKSPRNPNFGMSIGVFEPTRQILKLSCFETASITIKFCVNIKTINYSMWVVPLRIAILVNLVPIIYDSS